MKKIFISILFSLPLLSFAGEPIRPEKFELNYHFIKLWSSLDTKSFTEELNKNNSIFTENKNLNSNNLTTNNSNISSLKIIESKEYTYHYPKANIIPKILFSSDNQIVEKTIALETLDFPLEYTTDFLSNSTSYGKVNFPSCSLFDLNLASQYPVIGQKTDEFVIQQNILSINDTLSIPKTKDECRAYRINYSFKFTTNYFLDRLTINAVIPGNPPFILFKPKEQTWLFYIPTNRYKKDVNGVITYLHYVFQVSY